MATEKKRGAPASASKSVRPRNVPRHTVGAEERAAKKAQERARKLQEYSARRTKADEAARRHAEDVTAHIPLKDPDTLLYESQLRKRDATWSEALGTSLRVMISAGLSLEKISMREGTPRLGTLLAWIADKDHPLSKIYYEAKELLVAYYEEKILEEARTARTGVIRTERDDAVNGRSVEERTVDAVERSKLAVSAYQWALGHMRPKKHGRKPDDGADQPNEQLKALFDSLKEGPR